MSADAVGPADAASQVQKVLEETARVNLQIQQELDAYLVRTRGLLDGALHQAVFQLVTDQRPEAFLALDDGQRRGLRLRLGSLVARCREQLTIRRLVEKGLRRLQQQNDVEVDIPDFEESLRQHMQPDPRQEIRLDLQNRPLLAGFDPGRLLGGSQAWPAADGPEDLDDPLESDTDDDDLDGLEDQLDPGFDQPLPIPADPVRARRWLGLADHALSLHLLELSDAVNRELVALELLGDIPEPPPSRAKPMLVRHRRTCCGWPGPLIRINWSGSCSAVQTLNSWIRTCEASARGCAVSTVSWPEWPADITTGNAAPPCGRRRRRGSRAIPGQRSPAVADQVAAQPCPGNRPWLHRPAGAAAAVQLVSCRGLSPGPRTTATP